MTAIRLLVYSFLIPSEFNFTLGSFVLGAYRLVLICLIPYVIWLVFKKSHITRWSVCDALALSVGVWPVIAFSLNTGIGAALESGGIQTLELVLPYFLIRLQVDSHEKRKSFAKILFTMVAILFFLGLPESIFGRHFTHEIASVLSGTTYTGSPEQRFGIWRVMGPTDHAIIFGALCAVTMSIAIALAQRKPKIWFIVGFSGAGTIISASSAPILAVLVQLGMLAWAKLTRGYRNKWWLLLGLFILFYIVVDMISNRDPIRVMFTYLLLNPETGYARYYMWVNSFEVAAQSTWGLLFGYGYNTDIFEIIDNMYWRNLLQTTVDSFWLILLLRFGATMLLLFSVFVILVFARSLRIIFSTNSRSERNFMQAWFVTAFAMTLIATTVHFWGYMACMYMMVIAAGVGETNKSANRKRKHAHASTSSRKPFQRHKVIS